MLTTWKKLLTDAMKKRGEKLSDLEACTLTKADMAKKFDAGFGDIHGAPFTAWTAKSVYFPTEFDGKEQVGSVSRHPDGKPTPHQ